MNLKFYNTMMYLIIDLNNTVLYSLGHTMCKVTSTLISQFSKYLAISLTLTTLKITSS
jgi:hypothetical protein